MDDVYYLVHSTDRKPDKWKQINTGHIDDFEHQFPGAFFTLVTKKNIDKIHLYPDSPTTLIFSKKLLEQNNYHINVRDYNGFITEENTYFPFNLDEAVKKIDENDGNMGIENEVVFHDPVSMKYLCSSIENKTPEEIPTNVYLPHIPIENKVEPDLTKEPFFCFPLEKNYTGRDPLDESSREFFQKMANLCGVKSELSNDKIIEEAKKKIPELYKHRNEQNTNALKQTPYNIKPFTIKNPLKPFTIKNPLTPMNTAKPINTDYKINFNGKLNGGKLRKTKKSRKTRKAKKNRHSMRKR
jgi:hypothetical protein